MYRISIIIGWYVLLGLYGACKSAAGEAPVAYTFKEYQYKDSPKNEITFREYETACEQSSACQGKNGLARTQCIRECVSPSCYRELYQDDPVEVNRDTDILPVEKRETARWTKDIFYPGIPMGTGTMRVKPQDTAIGRR